MPNWTLYEGDCIEVMRSLPENSVDAVVTDPPYGLEFMGKEWDKLAVPKPGHLGGFADGNKPSFERVRRHLPAMQEWHYRWAVEALRVLKPGGHLLAFGGTRTYHRMACAVEDAGFEVRDCLMWLYGSGFPKSLDVSKASDKRLGAEREKIRIPASKVRNQKSIRGGHGVPGGDRPWMKEALKRGYHEIDGDVPATPEAKQWEGWGTALKPANEPIVLARKPLSERTIAANVLKWGTGGLNIDASRIAGYWERSTPWIDDIRGNRYNAKGNAKLARPPQKSHDKGRFPANILLDEEAAEVLDGQQAGASRFFYIAKASRSERTMGGKVENNHPTVKPIQLMRYLCRLITPPGGTVLDPFAGSGTTLIAAVQEGFNAIGIEREPEYCNIIRQRMAAVQQPLPLAK